MKKNIKRTILAVTGVVVAGVIGKFYIDSTSEPMYGVPYGELSEEQKQTAINTFNAQFIQYTRTVCTNSQIRGLVERIRVNNVVNNAKGPIDEKYVIYTGPETSGLKENAKYTVKVKYNNEGYVCEVIVTESEEDDSNATQNNNVNEINNNTENKNEDVIKPIQR